MLPWKPWGSSVAEREPRMESGPVAFGSDWPGLFLRGDDAYCYGAQLEIVLEAADDEIVDPAVHLAVQHLRGLAKDLASVDFRRAGPLPQRLRSARECLAPTVVDAEAADPDAVEV